MVQRTDLSTRHHSNIFLESRLWKSHSGRDFTIYYRGSIKQLEEVESWSTDSVKGIAVSVKEWIQSHNSCYAFIVESQKWCVGVVDHIRSIPLYYQDTPGKYFLADSPHSLLTDVSRCKWDQEKICEILLSGYVHGASTLAEGISQLQSGQMLVVDKDKRTQEIFSHYVYFPERDTLISDRTIVRQWATTLDLVFEEMAQDIGEKEVWVPLSGGYDSRLVLAKLVEHGCRNIQAFSYGVTRNSEIQTARQVAKHLGVKWYCLESNIKNLKHLFSRNERKACSNYADGLHIVPGTLEYEAIHRLNGLRKINQNSVIVNGLSGDFLFGGHIPTEVVEDPRRTIVIEYIIKKHCNHVHSKRLAVHADIIREKLKKDLDEWEVMDGDIERLCAFVEHWDWKERQAKSVLVAQRLYEFFDLAWLLPFWDKRLLNVATQVPLRGRIQQKLHKDYLVTSNHKELFLIPRVKTSLWQGKWRIVPYFAKLVGVIFGGKQKQAVYRRLYFFGYFRHQLGLFGIKQFLNVSKIARPPYVIALGAVTRLRELGIDTSEHLD
jgi:asparagine synthase (glutamine-hydrolysing)